ncbi:MAG: hypothetical protein AAF443_09040 [Chlamydiota bacterium]
MNTCETELEEQKNNKEVSSEDTEQLSLNSQVDEQKTKWKAGKVKVLGEDCSAVYNKNDPKEMHIFGKNTYMYT